MDTRRTTGLITPTRNVAPKETFLDNHKKVGSWAANLPLANLGEMSRRVFKTLLEFNRINVPRQERLKVAEQFQQPIEYISTNLRKHYFDVPLPLSARSRKIAILNRELYAELAIAYKTFIEDDRAANHPKKSRDALAIAINRALFYLGQVIYQSAIIYDPYPKHAWAEVHLLYQYARKLELIHFQKNASGDKPNSIEAIYQKILLFSLSSPYSLRQREIDYIFNRSLLWQAFTSVTEMKPVDSAEGIFIIHPATDAPPIHLNLETKTPSKRSMQFHTGELIRFLQNGDLITKTGSGKADHQTINSHLSKTLMERLVSGLKTAPKRDSIRTKHQSELHIAVGLSAVHDFIIASQPSAPRSNIQGQSENTTTDWLDENQRVGNPGFKEAINHFSGTEFSLSPEQGFAKEHALIGTHSVISDSGLEHTWSSREKAKNAEPYPFHSINESAGGYCISWEGENPPHIKVGEIIGVQPETGGDSNVFSIGISRWIKNTPEIGLQLGIELISPGAQAVYLSYINSKSGIDQQFPALLLSQLHADPQQDSLIVPTLPFRLDDQLWLVAGSGKYRIGLSKLRDSSGAFSHFEFKMLDERQVENREEEQTEEPDFDTIWATL